MERRNDIDWLRVFATYLLFVFHVGMVFNPQPRTLDDESVSKPCDGVRYLAGFYTLDELGVQQSKT